MSERDNSNYEELEKLAERYKSGSSSFEPIRISQDSLEDKIKEVKEKKAWDDYKEDMARFRQEQTVKVEAKTKKKEKSNKASSIKERLMGTLGFFGVLIYFLVRVIICILPFVMIGGNFFITFLLLAINSLVPFASAVFWIWGLIGAIKGVQDIWAIIYYIAFAIIWIPFYISTIVSFINDKRK